MRQAALVHELAHALADQHFHLERFIKQGGTMTISRWRARP